MKSGIRYEGDAYGNLFLVDRDGVHRYNKQDYSMLTANDRCGQHYRR